MNCNKINNINNNNDSNNNDFIKEFIDKLKAYMNIDIKFKKTLHNFKSYVMHIYYNHRYNLYFQINDNKIKYFFFKF